MRAPVLEWYLDIAVITITSFITVATFAMKVYAPLVLAAAQPEINVIRDDKIRLKKVENLVKD